MSLSRWAVSDGENNRMGSLADIGSSVDIERNLCVRVGLKIDGEKRWRDNFGNETGCG